MIEPRHINTADIDWTQTDAAIARKIGTDYITTRGIRRAVFGLSYIPTARWMVRYGHLPWDKVDWENRPNGAIGKDFGVDANIVRQVRLMYAYPPNIGSKMASRTVTDEMLESVDWEWTQDSELARKFVVSRERMRQIRLMKQKPPSKVEHFSRSHLERLRWARENFAKIKGRPINEVIVEFPRRKHMTNERTKWVQIDDLLGLGLDLTSHVPRNAGKYSQMNFDLQNRVLSFIWGCCQPVIANFRYQNHRQAPKWKRGGYRKDWRCVEFYNAVWQELEKAIKSGRNFNFADACKMLDVPTPEQQKEIDSVSKS